MLDLKWIRANPEAARQALAQRGAGDAIGELLAVDARRLQLLRHVEDLRARRNASSEEIGRLKRQGEDASALLNEMRQVGEQLGALEGQLKEADGEISDLLLLLPNRPAASVPVGPDASGNVEVRRWGEPRRFDFEAKAHWDIGTALGILDFERAGKISGSRFTVLMGAGARLERALIDFMLELHTRRHGYTEVAVPYLVSSETMRGTGQLPKFAAEAFKVEGDDLWLVPTAEVPLTNLHRGEILEADSLPRRFVAYTACFRSEAGAAGRDTRGLIRQHQFDKVELVWLTRPEASDEALGQLTGHAEAVLQALELPYRVIELCTGDLGFSAARTYDIEVWLPSYGRYAEISSCSSCSDFQARRAGLRYRPAAGKPVEFVHTLNGSGLAAGRCLAALLENYQQPDGSVVVPEALRPLVGADRIS